jgi:enoyl reductase-like protein
MCADLVVDDQDGQPIALVRVRASVSSKEELDDYVQQLSEVADRSICFDPPGVEALAETGLIERIAKGMTRRTEMAAGAYSLS